MICHFSPTSISTNGPLIAFISFLFSQPGIVQRVWKTLPWQPCTPQACVAASRQAHPAKHVRQAPSSHIYNKVPSENDPSRVRPEPPWNGMKAVKRARIPAKNARKRAENVAFRPRKSPPEAAISAKKPPCGSNYCKKREIYLSDIQMECKNIEK